MSVEDGVLAGFGALLVLLFVWTAISSFIDLIRAVASQGWPVARGTVVTSGWKSEGRRGFAPVVVYRYEAGGQRREADRIAFWGFLATSTFSESSAEAWSQRWVEGWDVDVRHHPTKPEIAVLVPGLNARILLSVLSAVLLVGMCVSTAVLFLIL